MSERIKRADGVLTREQLTAALAELEQQGKHPTARELAELTGISHSNVRHHVEALQQEGLVTIKAVPSGTMRHEIMLIRSERS